MFPKGQGIGVYSQPIQITKLSDGSLKLLVDVHDKHGEIVVRFNDEGFVVNPLFIKGQPNKSTLVVDDRNGEEVLRATYTNKHIFKLDAQLVLGNDTVLDTRQLPHFCFPPGGGLEMNFVPQPPK